MPVLIPDLFPDPNRCGEHDRLLPCIDCRRQAADYEGRALGEIAKREGMARVQVSENPELAAAKLEWMEAWPAAARRMCQQLSTFTGDQLVTGGFIEPPPGDGRIIGPANSRMVKLGWAEKTRLTRPSTNPAHHKQPREVWVSLIYRGRQRTTGPCSHCGGLGLEIHDEGPA